MPSTTNSTFDPNTQPVTILMADGHTPVTILLSDIDSFTHYIVACSINFGCQMGACFIMLFVVMVLTKEAKRRTALFILNVLSLLFGFLRALLLALYGTSPWVHVYPFFTGDFSLLPRSAYATSVAGSVFPFLMTVTVNMSLVLQAHTVCKNMRRAYQYSIIALACLVLLAAVGFRFAEMVTNSIAIVSASEYTIWLQKGTLATETSSIWFFSIIFTAKLIWILITRKVMGWKQWSGVKILAAMGGCTMIIPSIFAGLEYTNTEAFPESGTLALTMVALLLPLSSLWAGVAIDHETSTLDLSHLSGTNSTRHGSELNHPYHGPLCGQFGPLSTNSSAPEASIPHRKCSIAHLSPTSIDSRIEYFRSSTRDSTELDLEAMGVRVDRSYGVRSDN